MPPVVLSLILALIQESPEIIAELETLFSGGVDPTPADWAAIRARIQGKSYADYDPAQTTLALPAGTVIPVAFPPAIASDAALSPAATSNPPPVSPGVNTPPPASAAAALTIATPEVVVRKGGR